jgi:hypothetical protein
MKIKDGKKCKIILNHFKGEFIIGFFIKIINIKDIVLIKFELNNQ